MSVWTIVVDGFVVCLENNISEEVNVFLRECQHTHGANLITVLDFMPPCEGVTLYYEPALYGAAQLARLANVNIGTTNAVIVYADNPVTYDVTMKWAADMKAVKVLVTVPEALEPHMLYEHVQVVPWLHACPFTPTLSDCGQLNTPRQLTCVLFGQRNPVTHPLRSAFLQARHAHTVVVPAPNYDNGCCIPYTILQSVWADAAMVFVADEPKGGLLSAHFEVAGSGNVILTSAKAVELLKAVNIHAEVFAVPLCMRLPDHRETGNMETVRSKHQVSMRAKDLHELVKNILLPS